MLERNKGKLKIEISMAMQNINKIISPTSEVKKKLELSSEIMNLQKYERIHETILDEEVNKEFITSEYNKDVKTSCFRSPYTNRYFPEKQQTLGLSPYYRDFEEKGNYLFSEYARLYYGEENCIANFYLYQSEQGLNITFFVKKTYTDEKYNGVWCSSNIIEIRGDPAKSVTYKLQTYILYELNVVNEADGSVLEIFGSNKKNRVDTKRLSPEYEIDQFHLMVTGKMIEEMETLLRQQIDSIFVAKTKEISFKTRFINTKDQENQRKTIAATIMKMRSQNSYIVS